MTADPPFLRSPPFPWVDAATAAVSTPGRSRVADPDTLLAAIAAARVGGAFWRNCPAAPAEAMRDRIVAAVEAASYRNPFTGATIDPLSAVAILADWRRMIDANRGIAAAVGIAAWKRPAMAQFLWDGAASPLFLDADDAIARAGASGGAVVYWPSRVGSDFHANASAARVATWQVEDGFVRSAGLGAECHPPMSVIVDATGGAYFDPAAPSLIENILATHDFDAALLVRAARLRERIVAARIGKYGVDRGPAAALPAGRRIVVAIGQVADDLSVLYGGGAGGMDTFLRRVRAEEPDAHIVYRPHPDVVAGLRRGASEGLSSVDQVATGGSLLSLIERADAVHVLSSLTGFEALLRGVPVVVHGTPFYAGWGLTRDLVPAPARRGRALSIDALTAGALILAPRYRDPVTELPCPPEVLVERLANGAAAPMTLLSGFRRALGHTMALGRRRA
ncbi:beta-3-deoxy-D-manno-oct-2-ulosonic acid transferase [Sphingomonas sp. SUN019]|uniref:capsular polysaccharide export protein, LipB/KpsS family n=1 Tax=Sphingomonas sp. SUN019 TaxID=2937788 RepID=UPI0021643E49|nr:beta-3-deoxy-D-manno-oct-2-ulosonic acid transferase [Sphingomonas sp. SUN019]UVO52385.1 beta-3-deoxy-D-manno-oct-2-ulosonic acid transferase [Sphingomonas sp. SUN019]